MLSTTAQCVERKLRADPTPMIDVDTTWVVETGMPSRAVTINTVAELMSAANPLMG